MNRFARGFCALCVVVILTTGCGEDKHPAPKTQAKTVPESISSPEKEKALAALKQRGVSLDGAGFTSAAATGSFELIDLYLATGMDVNTKDSHKRTPLHVAAQGKNVPLVELLISKGADVNTSDENGSTPLMDAAWQGDMPMVKLLVAKGAQVNAKNVSGYTPLKAAHEQKHGDVSDFLASKGAAE